MTARSPRGDRTAIAVRNNNQLVIRLVITFITHAIDWVDCMYKTNNQLMKEDNDNGYGCRTPLKIKQDEAWSSKDDRAEEKECHDNQQCHWYDHDSNSNCDWPMMSLWWKNAAMTMAMIAIHQKKGKKQCTCNWKNPHMTDGSPWHHMPTLHITYFI